MKIIENQIRQNQKYLSLWLQEIGEVFLCKLDIWLKKYIFTCCAHHIQVVHFTLVLDLLFRKSFLLRWPKTCILQLHWIYRIILDKTRSCLWKSEIGFWSYCLVRPNHLGPIGLKLVFRLQNPRSRYFLILDSFIVFNLWFGKKWDPVCGKRSKGSGLMLWHDKCLGPSGPQLAFRPQTPRLR